MADLRTDGSRGRGKRERLVEAATQMLHQQGVERTTLAEVAKAAEVPPGNVYYYFKTKDDLVAAVIEVHAQQVGARLRGLENHSTPKARLKAYVRMVGEQADLTARYGSPQGTLCSELDKRGDDLTESCATMMSVMVDWTEQQFRGLGRRDSRELAFALVGAYQGSALLANAFSDPEILIRETRRLSRWIDSLS